MSTPDAFEKEMRLLQARLGSDPFELDEQTTNGLLARALPPDDAPPAYQGVARVIGALAEAPTAAELDHERPAVAGIAAAIASTPRLPARRSSMPPKKLAVALAVMCFTLVGGLAVAGAIDAVPSPNDASNGHSKAGEHTPTSIPPEGAGQGGSSEGKGSEISGLATETDAEGVDKGAEISDAASDGTSGAGDDHPTADSVPPVPVSTPSQADEGLSHKP